MSTDENIRPSPIAGTWYPSDPKKLALEIDNYINSAKVENINGEIVAIIAPHAGLRYSGPVAGHAFRAISETSPDIIVIVSPMHHPYIDPILTTAHDAYATPLGEIEVNKDLIKSVDKILQEDLGSGITYISQDSEHSLEIQLPFIQRTVQNSFTLVPLMVRDQSVKFVRVLGKALNQVMRNQRSILVASSDLSHFYPQNIAEILDNEVLKRIEAFDPNGVINVEAEGKGFACGRGAVAAVLWAAKGLGADRVKILNYATSGEITGDYSQVVGYGAAAVYKDPKI